MIAKHGHVTLISWTIFFFFAVFLFGHADVCHGQYQVDTPITSVSITTPSTSYVYWAPSTPHNLHCTTSTDTDEEWVVNGECADWEDVSDSVTHWWSCNYGSFQYDDNVGTDVVYYSPASHNDTVTVYADDAYAPVSNNYLANDAAQSDSFEVYLSALIHIQVDSVNVEGTTLYVNQGEEIQFDAIKSGGAWPTGTPYWGGTAGLSGVATSKTKTFNTTGEFTVTASDGDTVLTVTVKVYDVEIKAADGVSSAPTWIKVGESENYYAKVNGPASPTPSFQWSESSAKISMTSTTSQTVTVTAGGTASTSENDQQIQVVATVGGKSLDAAYHNLTVKAFTANTAIQTSITSPSADIRWAVGSEHTLTGSGSDSDWEMPLNQAISDTVTLYWDNSGNGDFDETVGSSVDYTCPTTAGETDTITLYCDDDNYIQGGTRGDTNDALYDETEATDSVTITTVAIGHLQVNSSNVEGTTLYVRTGESITFNAIADPSTPWPDDCPEWSGWGLSGSGAQKVKTFTSAGEDTIMAECGTSSKSVTVKVYDVQIKESDGTSDPAEWIKISDSEQYKAVVSGPGGDSGSFQWSESSAKISLTSADQQTVTVNAGSTPSDSEGAEQISLVFTPAGGAALSAVTHNLSVYQVQIKASDGVSSPSAVITDSEQYKAVVSGLSSNLTYAWTVTQGDCISLENATSQTVTVLGEGNGAAQIQVTVSKDGTALDPVTHDLTVARYTEGSEITVSVTDPETSFVYFPVSTSQTVTASGSDSDWDVSANGGAGGLVSDSVTLYWTLETGEFPSGAVGTSVSYTSPTTAGETDLVTVYCDDDSEILGEERGTTNKALFAEEPPVSDTFEVMAVGVAHIQVDESNVDGTTLYVSKGESVTFDAIADPAVSWPSGYPVWSGAASGTEAGETSAEVQFNATGEVTVTASCGTSSKSVTVKVYEVVIKASDGTSAPVGEIEADGSEQYKAVVTGPGGDSGSFQWSESSEKIGLTSADQQTVTVNAGSTASASVDAEELSVVFTPSGGTALTAVTHDLTVVAVGHIEVDSSNVDGTTLSVMKGETVTFDAIADPSSASWPTGYPTWSGWGLSGTATQKVKTFTSTGQDTITVTCGTSSKSVVVTVYEVVIKASDGTSDPAEWMNINDTEQYKAVVTGPGGDSGSFQWSESSEKISLTSADQQTVTVNSGASASDSEDAEEISVVFTPTGGTALTAVTHDLTVYQVRIMASDGVSSPPEEVEITEQYKGVVSGLSSNLTYAWTLASGEEYVDLTNTTSQTVTVTTEANGTVQLQLTVSKDGTALDPAIHEFESVPYSVGEPITPITITTPSEDGIRWGVGTYWHTLVAEPYPVLDCDQDYEENWYYDACTVWWTATDGSFQNDDNIGTTVYYECPEDGQYVTLTVHGDDNYNGDPYYYDDEEVTDDREIVAVEVGSITVGDLDITDEYYCTDDGDLTLTAIPYPTGGWPTSEPEWYLQDGETFDYEHTGETWDPEFPAGGPYDVKVTCGTDYETADVIVMAVTVDTPSAMAVNDTQVITCNAIPNPGDIHDMVDACLYWTFTPGSDPAPQVDLEPYSTDSETALLTATSAGTGFVQVWYYAEGVEGGVCVSDSKPVTITGVGINEPAVGVVGEATEMSASGYPSGSTYTWSVDNGSDPDADAAGYFVGSGTTINTVSFTGTTAGTGFVKVTYGAVEDTAPLVVLNVTMLSGAQSLEKGDTVELSCNAVPDPEAIGGYLYWYVDNGESAKRADGKFEPLVANEQETMVFTATKAGTGLITVEYWYDSLHATDAVGLVVAGVTIDTAPLIFVKDKAESVSATAEPDGSSTEWYEWTVLPSDGTGDGDFIPEYGYEATANPTTFDPTDAGTGIVQVEYTYDGLASYTDTADMVILSVNPTPTEILLDVGSDTVVDSQAVPDPSDVGGGLKWYINWGSVGDDGTELGKAELDPETSEDQETTLVTAVSFGTGNLMVEYSLGDKTAYGTVPITIGGVKIVIPTVIDLGVDDSTDLDSAAAPSGGTFSWSLVEGGSPTAAGTFAQSTDEDPTFTGTTAGTAMAKVEYSVSGKTYSDSVPLVVRQVEMQDVPEVIPVGKWCQFLASATPDVVDSQGDLVWSLIDGDGIGEFWFDNDTAPAFIATGGGTTIISVRYEGNGVHQGYAEDTQPCTLIDVAIGTCPETICLGDTADVACSPIPELDVTNGILLWSLIDADGTDITTAGMFNPRETSETETVFSTTGAGTGNYRINVCYTVGNDCVEDSKPVKLRGELSISPAFDFLLNGETQEFIAFNSQQQPYQNDQITWSILEGNSGTINQLDCIDTAVFAATQLGTCIVKCSLNSCSAICDTAEVCVAESTLAGGVRYGSIDRAVVVPVPTSYRQNLHPKDDYLPTHIFFPHDCLIDADHPNFGLIKLKTESGGKDIPISTWLTTSEIAKTHEVTIRDSSNREFFQVDENMFLRPPLNMVLQWVNQFESMIFGFPYTTASDMFDDFCHEFHLDKAEVESGLYWMSPAYTSVNDGSPIYIFLDGKKRAVRRNKEVVNRPPIAYPVIKTPIAIKFGEGVDDVSNQPKATCFETMEIDVTLDDDYFHHLTALQHNSVFDYWDANEDGHSMGVQARFRLRDPSVCNAQLAEYYVPGFCMRTSSDAAGKPFEWKIRFLPPIPTENDQYWEVHVCAFVTTGNMLGIVSGNYDELNYEIKYGDVTTVYHCFGYNAFYQTNWHTDTSFYAAEDPLIGMPYDAELPVPRLVFKCRSAKEASPIRRAKNATENASFFYRDMPGGTSMPVYITGLTRMTNAPCATPPEPTVWGKSGWLRMDTDVLEPLAQDTDSSFANILSIWLFSGDNALVHSTYGQDNYKEEWGGYYSPDRMYTTVNLPGSGTDLNARACLWFDQGRAQRLDKLFRDADDLDVGIMLAIWGHTDLRSCMSDYWGPGQWEAEGSDASLPWSSIAEKELLTSFLGASGEAKEWKYQKNYYNYLVARYSGYRSLALWESVSEYPGLFGPSGTVIPVDMQEGFARRVAECVRELDPYGRPVSASSQGWGSPDYVGDYVSTHAYGSLRDCFGIGINQDGELRLHNTPAFRHDVVDIAYSYPSSINIQEVPWFHGECGAMERSAADGRDKKLKTGGGRNIFKGVTAYHYTLMADLMRGAAGAPLKWNDSKEFGEMQARPDDSPFPSDYFKKDNYPPDYWKQLRTHRTLVKFLIEHGLAPWTVVERTTNNGSLWMRNETVCAGWLYLPYDIFQWGDPESRLIDITSIVPEGASYKLTWINPWTSTEICSEVLTQNQLAAVNWWSGKMEKVMSSGFDERSQEDVFVLVTKID